MILGSYFTCFTSQEFKFGRDLRTKHTYVDSRIEQAKLAREAGGDGFAVSVIEIPWVFGVTPGRTSLWIKLIKWANSRAPLFAPDGGTSAVSVETVARVTVAALQARSSKNIPVAEGNFTWAELLNKIARTHRTVRRLPTVVMGGIGYMWSAYNTVSRQPDTGLAPHHFLSEVFTQNLFIDLNKCRKEEIELGLPGDKKEATSRMDASFIATIDSCLPLTIQPQALLSTNKISEEKTTALTDQSVFARLSAAPANTTEMKKNPDRPHLGKIDGILTTLQDKQALPPANLAMIDKGAEIEMVRMRI